MPKEPIYSYIANSVVDGRLPPSFGLDPYDQGDRRIRFADGAIDGMRVYHMAAPAFPSDLPQRIGEGIKQVCAGDYSAADATFGELGNQYSVVWLIDELQDYVVSHRESISARALRNYAIFLLTHGTDKEFVKTGFSFLELFEEPDKTVKRVVRTLGLSDEFTLFAAWCVRGWVNGNEELFELARKASGWGRIHVVEMLEPETEAIREWLLREGVSNAVMPGYSALTCYVKAGVAERLEREMSHDEFSAITTIVHAALDDEPVVGLSALEDPEAELARYIGQARKQQLDLGDCECLNAVASYAERRGLKGLAEACNAMLESDAVRNLVVDELTKGRGMTLAHNLGIPYKDALLEAMRSDFDGLFFECRWLVDDPKYFKSLLELFRENIPLEGIEDDPRDEVGLGKEFDTYIKLSALLPSLRHRMPAGLDYVMRALTSPTVGNRTMSHRVLRCWVSDEGRPLSEVSPEAYERLLYAYGREPREDLRAAMKPLIDGETSFEKSRM